MLVALVGVATSTTEFQRVSASSFLPASQSNLTCCSKSILAAGCNMQSVVCTAVDDGIGSVDI